MSCDNFKYFHLPIHPTIHPTVTLPEFGRKGRNLNRDTQTFLWLIQWDLKAFPGPADTSYWWDMS